MAANRSLGTLTLDLIAKIGGFTEPLDKAAREADKKAGEMSSSFGNISKGISAGIMAVGAAAAAGAAIAIAGIRNQINELDDLSKAALRSGVSTEEFSALTYAAGLADVSIQDLQGSLGKLTRNQSAAAQGTQAMVDAFDRAGVAATNADGTMRNSMDVLYDFADAWKESGGSPEMMATGLEVFGRSFQNIIPLINGGSEGLRAATEEAEKFGFVVSTEAGQAAEAFNDNLSRLGGVMDGVWRTIAADLLPDLVNLSDSLVQTVIDTDLVGIAVQSLQGLIDGIVIGFNAFQVAVTIALIPVRALHVGINGLIGAYKALGSAIANVFRGNKSPMDALKGLWSDYKDVYQETTDGLSELATGTWEAVARDVKDAGDALSGERRYQAQQRAKDAAAQREEQQKAAQAAREAAAELAKEGKAADDLNKEYERLLGTAQRRSALSGKTSREAEVLYDLEHTQLKNLTAEQKEQLLTLARQEDAQKALEKTAKSSGAGRAAASRQVKQTLSEEERALIQLNKSYTDLIAGLDRRIALAGTDSEIEAVKYDLAKGKLAQYNEEQRASILLKTEEAVAAEKAAEATKKANQEAVRALEERSRKMEDVNRRYREYLGDIQHEINLLGMSAQAQARLDILRDMGIDAASKSAEAITRSLELYHAQKKAVDDQIDAMDELRGSFSSFLKDVVSGSKSFKDAFMDMLDSINARLMDSIANNFTEQLFGERGTANSEAPGAEGFFSRMFGGLFGVKSRDEIAQEMPAGVDPFAEGAILALQTEAQRMADGVIQSVDLAMQTVAANVQATAMSSATGVEAMVGSTESTSNTASTAITQAVSGEGGFFSMLKGLFSTVMGMFSSGGGGGGGAGSWISTIMGAFGGGRAGGGNVDPFGLYRVNELGPELLSIGQTDYLMMGSRGGKVTPHNRVGGGGVTQVNNFQVHGRMDRRTETQIAASVGQRTNRAISRTV